MRESRSTTSASRICSRVGCGRLGRRYWPLWCGRHPQPCDRQIASHSCSLLRFILSATRHAPTSRLQRLLRRQPAPPTPPQPTTTPLHLRGEDADQGQREAAELVVPNELVQVEVEQLKRQAQVVAEQEKVLWGAGAVGVVQGRSSGDGPGTAGRAVAADESVASGGRPRKHLTATAAPAAGPAHRTARMRTTGTTPPPSVAPVTPPLRRPAHPSPAQRTFMRTMWCLSPASARVLRYCSTPTSTRAW